MAETLKTAVATVGIDIGKNPFHIVGLDLRGAIVLRQRWLRGQVKSRFANMPPCLVGMEACVGAHHLSRKLKALGHDARLMPAKYVRPYPFAAISFACGEAQNMMIGSRAIFVMRIRKASAATSKRRRSTMSDSIVGSSSRAGRLPTGITNSAAARLQSISNCHSSALLGAAR